MVIAAIIMKKRASRFDTLTPSHHRDATQSNGDKTARQRPSGE